MAVQNNRLGNNKDTELPAKDSLTGKNTPEATKIAELTEKVEGALREIADTKNLTVLGFYILIVMVVTLLVVVIGVIVQTIKDDKPNIQYVVPAAQLIYGKN